ncbi:hypothetical protein [Picrophilus oshimae]|uniref:Uncharacterized protein n=1 Tax=Picrophilus torridus (strain ATCC 700027 / DSM 9790 / JCM 10055 / NBRC 100828 / KAW 2/3) TaxID=1122961 RepID=A0A8G2FXC7_PICTO|nr:hypothetical protein [Picrophilus oshimae]SMD31222.1 hypothetical protein SAMN02745355_1146 [Picrophilus oshimae DSM 9789]
MAEANGAVEEREKKEEEEPVIEEMPDREFDDTIDTNKINQDGRCPDGYVYVKPHKTFMVFTQKVIAGGTNIIIFNLYLEPYLI